MHMRVASPFVPRESCALPLHGLSAAFVPRAWRPAGWWLRAAARAHDASCIVLGAALLGYLAGLPAAPRRQLLVGIGFCGSLTTFSSWMVDAMQLISTGQIAEALGLIGFTLGLGMGAAALGFWLGQRLRPLMPPRSEP